jgi:hypothetical protein
MEERYVPMKCILNIKTNEIKNVSNVAAFKEVNTGLWIYTNRTNWKDNVRDKK